MSKSKPKKRQFALSESKNKALAKALRKTGDRVQDLFEYLTDNYIASSK